MISSHKSRVGARKVRQWAWPRLISVVSGFHDPSFTSFIFCRAFNKASHDPQAVHVAPNKEGSRERAVWEDWSVALLFADWEATSLVQGLEAENQRWWSRPWVLWTAKRVCHFSSRPWVDCFIDESRHAVSKGQSKPWFSPPSSLFLFLLPYLFFFHFIFFLYLVLFISHSYYL